MNAFFSARESSMSSAPPHVPADRMQDRDLGLDIARGIAIILVVYGHALNGAHTAGHSTYVTRLVTLLLYSTHITLLFQISGMLTRQMASKSLAEFSSILAVRVVCPYLLWSFVLLSLQFAMRDHTNNMLIQYQPISILWKGPAVMWFLYVLFVAHILLRTLTPFGVKVVFGIGVVLLLGPYLVEVWPNKSRFTGMFLIAAACGPFVSRYVLNPIVLGLASLIMVGTFLYATALAHGPIAGYPAFQGAFIPAIFAGPLLIYALSAWLACSHPKGRLQAFLVLIGRNTMAIFVTHILVTAGMRITLISLGMTQWWLIILLATTTGVILPLMAALLARRWGFSVWLGWR